MTLGEPAAATAHNGRFHLAEQDIPLKNIDEGMRCRSGPPCGTAAWSLGFGLGLGFGFGLCGTSRVHVKTDSGNRGHGLR